MDCDSERIDYFLVTCNMVINWVKPRANSCSAEREAAAASGFDEEKRKLKKAHATMEVQTMLLNAVDYFASKGEPKGPLTSF